MWGQEKVTKYGGVWVKQEKGMRRNVGHLESRLVSNSNRPQLCSQRFHFHPIPTVLCPRQNWFLLLVLNYFCPVSLSRPSWSRCSRQPPLKFTLLCNRQKARQIFPWKQPLHARIQKLMQGIFLSLYNSFSYLWFHEIVDMRAIYTLIFEPFVRC